MTEESTISLLHRTSAIIAKYDSIAKITGENFNIFNVLGMGSSEVKLHSALIAELINPNGKHDQGIVFLNHFLKTLREASFHGEAEEIFDKFKDGDVIIEVEKRTGDIQNEEGGNIDIIIRTKTRDAIIIENKIYANDQTCQLRRYHNYAIKNYNKKAILLYLTLHGKEASNETTFNDKHLEDKITPICISYKTFIIEWLDKCRKEAVNHPILRETITQYIYLLKQLTNQTTNNNMKKEIAEIIAQNSAFINSAEEIWKNPDEIKLQIIKKLMDTLSDDAEKLGWNFSIEDKSDTIGKDDTGFGFKLENKPYWIYFYFKGNYDNVEVGIDWNYGQVKDEVLSDDIRKHFKDFEYPANPIYEGWILGYNFQKWRVASWADKQSKISSEIIETTKMFLKKLESFNP